MRKRRIGIIGGSRASEEIAALAYEVGSEIARRGAILVCGGLGGVMEWAAKGARDVGGFTVGILPGPKTGSANPYIDLPIATNMGHSRNMIIVHTAEVLIAIDGQYGTLSEIAIALAEGKPVIGLKTWDIPGVINVFDAKTAVDKAFQMIEGNYGN